MPMTDWSTRMYTLACSIEMFSAPRFASRPLELWWHLSFRQTQHPSKQVWGIKIQKNVFFKKKNRNLPANTFPAPFAPFYPVPAHRDREMARLAMQRWTKVARRDTPQQHAESPGPHKSMWCQELWWDPRIYDGLAAKPKVNLLDPSGYLQRSIW